MGTKTFSEDEQRILAQNPFTSSVTSKQLNTTKEFKEEFMKLYLVGDKSPTQIVAKLGYDPKILGYNRISGIRCHIVQKYRNGEEFQDSGYGQKVRAARGNPEITPSPAGASPNLIQNLRTEVSYLRQEVAFLKKLIQSETGKKSGK